MIRSSEKEQKKSEFQLFGFIQLKLDKNLLLLFVFF